MASVITIRDIAEDVVSALEEKARSAGMSREAWLREQLLALAAQPIIKKRYAFRMYGKSGKGIIRRISDGPNGTGGGCSEFSQEEFAAYNRAQDLISRNEAGDREKAMSILQNAFEEVFEVAV